MKNRFTPVPVLAIILATTAFLGACEGPTGPEGPQGPQGIQGVQGPQGPIGNANVISGRVTLTEADWSTNTTQFGYVNGPGSTIFSVPARYSDVAVSDLTLDVINNGAVLLWLTPNTYQPTVFAPIPYRFRFIITTTTFYWVHDALVSEGNIRFLFFYEPLDASTSAPSPLDATQPDRIYRWVIIPPAAAAMQSTLPLAAGPDAVLAELEEQGFTVEQQAH